MLVRRRHAHRERRGRGLVRRPPQDARAALGRDDGVDGVLQRQDDVAHGDRERTAGAALAGDDRHDRRPEPGHEADRPGDRLGDAPLLGLGAGMRAGHVDERHDRQARSLRELHDAHRLAVALGVRHAEVAPDVLLRVGSLLLSDHDDPPAVDRREPGHDRLVVAEQPVAVELDDLLGHLRQELEDARAAQVARELHPRPHRGLLVDRRRGGLRLVAVTGVATAVEDPVNHGRPPRAPGPGSGGPARAPGAGRPAGRSGRRTRAGTGTPSAGSRAGAPGRSCPRRRARRRTR